MKKAPKYIYTLVNDGTVLFTEMRRIDLEDSVMDGDQLVKYQRVDEPKTAKKKARK